MNIELNNKTILVTGGAGFIGSNLCEALLEKGNQVICLDNFATGKRENIEPLLKDSNFILIEGDIRNLEDCTFDFELNISCVVFLSICAPKGSIAAI